MSGIQNLKNRIKGVNDTGKITNAMYLIASTKLQKAIKELEATRPYFNTLRSGIRRLFQSPEKLDSPYFFNGSRKDTIPDDSYGILVITADKGMAGAYNSSIIKQTEWLYNRHPSSKLFVVGEFGRKALEAKNIPFEEDFFYTSQRPTIKSSREIAYRLLDLYESNQVDRLYIIYTDMKSAMIEEPIIDLIMPFTKEDFDIDGDGIPDPAPPFEFIPSPEKVLRYIVYSYVTGFIYSALVDSFCSEQYARMTAMSSANDNARNIAAELQMQYNRMRQGEITNEIIEVSAGAKAQALHKKKENA